MLLQVRRISWWYWLATVPLIAMHLAGHPWALAAASTLCAIQALHFAVEDRSLVAFPVQVRLGFLAMLVAGAWEPLRFLHWVQLVGTTAFVLTGYCLLARLLSLLPWNRTEPFTLSLAIRMLSQAPRLGNVLHGMQRDAVSAVDTTPRPVGVGTQG
jgi:hypothetical protein